MAQQLTRRSFVAGAAAGVTASAFLAANTSAADAQLVWTTADWNLSEFRKLLAHPAPARQVYDIAAIGGGKFLNNIKNSLNGFRYGFGIPEQQIKVVAALHGPANMLNFDDSVWKKYQIGAWLKVTDPATGQPAERNIFYAGAPAPTSAKAADNPDDEDSIEQSRSIQTLQSRGVQFLCCHTAAEEQARILARQGNRSQSPEDIVRDLMAHALPGVLVVAAQVAAIALLQSEGRYSYITV